MSSDLHRDTDPEDKLPLKVKENTLGKLGVITFLKSLVELFKSRKNKVLHGFPPKQASDLPHSTSGEADDQTDPTPTPGRNA